MAECDLCVCVHVYVLLYMYRADNGYVFNVWILDGSTLNENKSSGLNLFQEQWANNTMTKAASGDRRTPHQF